MERLVCNTLILCPGDTNELMHSNISISTASLHAWLVEFPLKCILYQLTSLLLFLGWLSAANMFQLLWMVLEPTMQRKLENPQKTFLKRDLAKYKKLFLKAFDGAIEVGTIYTCLDSNYLSLAWPGSLFYLTVLESVRGCVPMLPVSGWQRSPCLQVPWRDGGPRQQRAASSQASCVAERNLFQALEFQKPRATRQSCMTHKQTMPRN